ncbi:hypothetical protein AB0L53_37530 [Nonomuraea sp. NPDC052129]|uniref:hypothetical protein n=1 Tax=Nonomuraea sp. NPDC052129 TaxID=3154651 RepID=UPI003425B982
MRAVVVTDQVDVQLGRHGLVDRDQELLELGSAVPAVHLPGDGPVTCSNVEGPAQECDLELGSSSFPWRWPSNKPVAAEDRSSEGVADANGLSLEVAACNLCVRELSVMHR